MCGRFTLTEDLKALAKQFDVPLPPPFASYAPRFNIAPTQMVIVVTEAGKRQIVQMRWGLIPSWAKDPSIGNRIINARAETLAAKPAFRIALRKRRCLIPADGFYEWQKLGNTKQPLRIVLRSRKPFGFAGLWDTWTSPQGEVIQSCTIITTEANALLKGVHDRMPVILTSEAQKVWLDPKVMEPSVLLPLLKPYPSSEMQYYVVSTMVNSPGNDRAECVVPLK
jgi:putative SOS response-associated peptidase YedK